VQSNGLLSHDLPPQLSEFAKNPISYADFIAENKLENNISNLRTFAFDTPSTSLGVLTSNDSLVVLFLLVLILRRIKSIAIPSFSSIGTSLAKSSHGPEWVRNNPEKIHKFGEYVFRLLYHTTVSVYGLWYFFDKPWWDSAKGGTQNLFINYPNQPVETGMIWYYLVQSAYNIDALAHLIEMSFEFKMRSPISKTNKLRSPIIVGWSPDCRGDFQEMMIHHIITNLLVIGSSHIRCTRIGSMVFMVHDISDIPVDLSKLANFMKWKISTIVCFSTMVIVWAITRLGILPFVIFKGIIDHSELVYTHGDCPKKFHDMNVLPFYALLTAIIALHLVWFTMFIKMGYLLINKGEAHDLSEHKQGEDQSSATEGKKRQ